MLLLTPGPVPTSDTDLISRLRAGLQHDLHLPDRAIRNEARGAGVGRIERIRVDLTGADLQQPPQVLPARAGAAVRLGTPQTDGQEPPTGAVPVRVLATDDDQ